MLRQLYFISSSLRPGFHLGSRPPAEFHAIQSKSGNMTADPIKAFTFSRKLRSISSLNFLEDAAFSQMSDLQLRLALFLCCFPEISSNLLYLRIY